MLSETDIDIYRQMVLFFQFYEAIKYSLNINNTKIFSIFFCIFDTICNIPGHIT